MARLPRTRTQANGSFTPGGGLVASGRTSPLACSLASTCDMDASAPILSCGHELVKAFYVAADDVEAGAPEIGRARFDPEPRRQVRGIRHTGRREQIIIARLECRRVLQVARVEAQPE